MTCRAVIGCVLAIALGTFLVSCSPSHKLISIQVTPATATASSGTTAQFKAIGSYIHPPSTNDITDSVTWASSNTAVATINPSTGIAMALSSGTTSITATMSSSSGPIVGTASLTVTGGSGGGLQSINLYPSNPTIPQLGQTNQFIALGVYSPASGSNDLTKQATWASSNVGIATISSPGFPGLAAAVGCGTTTITAEDQGVVGQTLLTVSCTPPPTPVLQSITLYPSDPTIPQLGQTNQFIALGVYSPASGSNDLTKQATWASSNVGIATISSPGFPGLAAAVGCGTTTITAEDKGVVGQTLLTVECNGGQTLQSITVLPGNPVIPQIGQTTQFIALGTLLAGGQVDLTNNATWASSNVGIATFSSPSPPGLAAAVGCGTTTVSAESQSIVGTALLTVSCGPITSIELLVTKTGSVPGTVVSSPAGIDCGTVCGALFNEGTGITLTAVPTPTSWTGCDQVIGGVCSFTVEPDLPGGTQKQVTANF